MASCSGSSVIDMFVYYRNQGNPVIDPEHDGFGENYYVISGPDPHLP